MIKAPVSLQDLRRRLYIKAKAEPGSCDADVRGLAMEINRRTSRTDIRWSNPETRFPLPLPFLRNVFDCASLSARCTWAVGAGARGAPKVLASNRSYH